MLVKVQGCACCGIDALTVTIETEVSGGLNFYLVGLPDSAVREAFQRISMAVQAVGYRIPGKRIVINMAPADLRKEGSAYDLPLAVSVLAASEQVVMPALGHYLVMGELALDGSLRPIKSALSMALHARQCGLKACVFPLESAYEAAVVEGIKVYGASHLSEVLELLSGGGGMRPIVPEPFETYSGGGSDFSQVCGQEQAKRALEIAAAGGHNVLLSGPPGAGKTFLAKCLPSILPPLTLEEAIETTRIYSAAGIDHGHQGLIRSRPFRSPHHTASVVALTGGGSHAAPGEISLAHNGVLYMDELPEFHRTALEVLRQPLEDGVIHLSRIKYRVAYPASFMLIASMNPCPCGYLGHPEKACSCTEYQVQHYRHRLSGPLLDRIDMQVGLLPVEAHELMEETRAETSAQIRERVTRARSRQTQRFAGTTTHCNAQMSPQQIREFCALSAPDKEFLSRAFEKLHLSARAHHRLLRTARTVADLAESDGLTRSHLLEVLGYVRGLEG